MQGIYPATSLPGHQPAVNVCYLGLTPETERSGVVLHRLSLVLLVI